MIEGTEVVRCFVGPALPGDVLANEDRGARYTGDTVGGAKLIAGTAVSLEFLGSLVTYLGILGMYLVLT